MSDPRADAAPGDRAGWSPPNLAPAATRASSSGPRQDIESARREGYDAGFAEGLAAGRARGEAIAAEMQALLQAMVAPFRETDAVLVREMTDLVERALRAVLDRELEAGAYDIEAVLTEALKVLGTVRVPVELRLNPQDAARCRELGLPPEPPLEVREDPSLSRGGLRLKAGSRVVDASVETRLEEVLATLRDAAGLPEPVPRDDSPSDPAGAP